MADQSVRRDIHKALNYREQQRRLLDLPQPDHSDDEELNANRRRNSSFVKSPRPRDWQTPLAPTEEWKFKQWVGKADVPFNLDNAQKQDYDMRGFWKGMNSGDPAATQAVNQNDGRLHFSDKWKTPYHKSFSNESQWANPHTAPGWNEQDQLVTPKGRVVFDERAKR